MKILNLNAGMIFFVATLFSNYTFAGCITKALEDSESGVVTFYEVSLNKNRDTLLVSILDENKTPIKLFSGRPINMISDERKKTWYAKETFFIDSSGAEQPFDGFMKVEKYSDMKSRFLFFQDQNTTIKRFACWGLL